ncbi:MAG: transposase [Lachnospiraceae bacterium]|nr:transposase [Lachnospiraceae bacterium]MDE7202197.1 transposase [Lachnospiraceae bacterium]
MLAAQEKEEALSKATRYNMIDHAVTYGEFYHQASSWRTPHCMVFRIEKPYNQLVYVYAFIVTNMEELGHWQVIEYYCNCGRMENFIGEDKNGFAFTSVSSKSRAVNANRLQFHALVYCIFNWFRRLVLPEPMNKNLLDTVRMKMFKIATKVVHTGKYVNFKLCSSSPYKEEIFETFSNIWNLAVQLE